MSWLKDMNLPTKLTLLRILLIPAIILFIKLDGYTWDVFALTLFVIACLTDFFDGYLARRNSQVTNIGKILDPIADKILVAAVLIVLVDVDRLHAVVVILLLSREFAIGALRDSAASNGVIIAANIWGKVKTSAQMIALGLVIYGAPFMDFDTLFIGQIGIYITVAVAWYSFYTYACEYNRIMNK